MTDASREPVDGPGARTVGALAVARWARAAPTGGPYDEDDLDPEMTDAGRLDFGAVRLPVPPGGTVAVEPTANGTLQAVHLALPAGRLSVSALAAPRSQKLWPALAEEIAQSLRDGGALVRSFTGEWGRELHARTGGATSLFVGVDGPRWMLYGVATGPSDDHDDLVGALRRMLRATVVVRGRSPYPPRTVLPLTAPEDRAPDGRAAAARAPDERVADGRAATAAPADPRAAAAPGGMPARGPAAAPAAAADPGSGSIPRPQAVPGDPPGRGSAPAPVPPADLGGDPAARTEPIPRPRPVDDTPPTTPLPAVTAPARGPGGRRRAVPDPAGPDPAGPDPAGGPEYVGRRRAAEPAGPDGAGAAAGDGRPVAGPGPRGAAAPEPGAVPALALLMGDPLALFAPAPEQPGREGGRHRRPDPA